MLKHRVITALVLAPLLVMAVLWLDTRFFIAIMAAIILIAAWEWGGLSGLHDGPRRYGFILLVAVLLSLIYLAGNHLLFFALHLLALLFWAGAMLLIFNYQKSSNGSFRFPLPLPVTGLLVLVPPWTSLLVLHAYEPGGAKTVLFLMILTWIADIAAYFSGRRWGRRRLCDRVSPGKSWEGVYGALLAGALFAALVAVARQMNLADILFFVLICLVTVSASIVGDLLESLVKRMRNVKDSGNILPGHGGVLDRIDSLTAALPVFVAAIWLWQKSL